MKAVIRALNNGVISAVLVVFYFVIIAAARGLYELSRLVNKKPRFSYWETPPPINYSEDYFSSPY